MTGLMLAACVLAFGAGELAGPAGHNGPQAATQAGVQERIINLSREKWRWMSERRMDSLEALFHEEAVFVSYGRSREARNST